MPQNRSSVLTPPEFASNLSIYFHIPINLLWKNQYHAQLILQAQHSVRMRGEGGHLTE